MSLNSNKMPTIHLIGDELENFYQLGLKDRESYLETKNFLHKLIKMDNFLIKKGYQIANELYLGKNLKKNEHYKKLIGAYAEGLDVDLQDLNFELLIPELLSSPSKFNLNIKNLLFGCSSFFRYDQKSQSIYHGRILDFPLHEIFFKHQRIVTHEFKNQLKIQALTIPGMPFPGVTAMNEKGLTLALHQKFSRYFNPEGTPIFYILYQILKEADSVKSTLKILKNFPSMTYWGMYLSTPEGKVVAIDLCGDRIDKEEYTAQNRPYFYFANSPIKTDQFNTDVIPFGMETFNAHRNQSVDLFMKNHKDQKIDHQTILKTLAMPDLGHRRQTPININSVQVASMNGKLQEIALIQNPYPLFSDNEFIKLDLKRKKIEQTLIKSKGDEIPNNFKKGYKHWMNAASYFDRDLHQEGFHELQMAQTLLKSYNIESTLSFYYQVYRYKYFNDKKIYISIKNELAKLEGKLPEHLENHRLLFLLRLNRLLKNPSDLSSGQITKLHLKKYYEYEADLNLLTLKFLKKLIYPKPELEDIIYLYQG